MTKITKNFVTKLKKIKLVLTDVDGVLTDGGMYFSDKGLIQRKFHTRDGMGVTMLLKYGIKTGIITKEKSSMVQKWSKKVNISFLYDGVKHKELLLPKICDRFSLKPNQIAYVGDDVNDLKIMSLVGFSVSPNDGVDQVKKLSNYVCISKGGSGVIREFADLLFKIQFSNVQNPY